MIHLNYLMIGDWVRTNPNCGKLACGIKSNIAMVCEIRFSDSDGMYVHLTNIKGRYYDDELEPIPLTDEFLRKNGFEYYHGNCAALSSEDKFSINQVQWPDEDGIAVWEYGIIQIRFVHEFQHLLKLCGIEKEIVL